MEALRASLKGTGRAAHPRRQLQRVTARKKGARPAPRRKGWLNPRGQRAQLFVRHSHLSELR